MTVTEYLSGAARLLERMATSPAADQVGEAVVRIAEALSARRPLLVCGNGGSASDAMHVTGEPVGRFLKERKALKAICLSVNPAVLTA